MSNDFGDNEDFIPLDPDDPPGPRRRKTKKEKEIEKQEKREAKKERRYARDAEAARIKAGLPLFALAPGEEQVSELITVKRAPAKHTKGLKHSLAVGDESSDAPDERPAKKAKVLDSDEVPTDRVLDDRDNMPTKRAQLFDNSDEGVDGDEGAVSLKVNEEYARRFEHNKKRAEKQKLEEKYGKSSALTGDGGSDTDSEDDVEEDDDGELATEALDAEISATLTAIRSKDPRVYDKNATFFRPIDENGAAATNGEQRQQSMTLKQYHIKNLLEGNIGGEDEEDAPIKTYFQEQAEARREAIEGFHAAADADEEEDDFLVPRPKTSAPKERVKLTEQDVENADKDPDTFLSNFLAARAWVPTAESTWKPLESDDSDEEERAEEYEDAYNMYFENPEGTNEKIVTYARDAVASTTVRREEKSSRRKARDAARAKREAEKKEREEELARLRKLKIEDMEERVKRIRKTAGLGDKDFKIEEWAGVLEGDWSDDQWDREMRKRFGDIYYDDNDGGQSDEEASGHKTKKSKPKKPKFDDDIDIKDLVPDYDDEETEQPTFTLTDDEEDAADGTDEEGEDNGTLKRSKSSKQHKKDRADAKSAARRDRRRVEKLVDDSLQYEAALAANPKAPTRFCYRETSPINFGMTPRDILLANDAQLNQFAGLKKLASFRDREKKKKDKKYLSKKARLRQWRKDTFGDAEGPKGGFEVLLGDEAGAVNGAGPVSSAGIKKAVDGGVDIREGGGKKKKRSRKSKGPAFEA